MENFNPTSRPVNVGNRTAQFQESVIREMTRVAEEVGALNLSQGLPDMPTPEPVRAAAVAAIQAGENQYTFPFGLPAFREAIARKTSRYNRIPTDAEENVTVTCGVSEAMFCAILALTEPGDEAIIFQPWYENYVPDCLLAGVTPRFVPLHGLEYSMDLDELEAAFSNRTRLILINTPHNPTGKMFTHSELAEIARLCQKFGVIAVTDEIYETIYYDENTHISPGSLPGMQDRTVTISGLGKTYATTGWRVGWTVAPSALTAQIRKVHDYLTVCAPGPFQWGGIAALNLPETYYQSTRAEYARSRALLLDGLKRAGFIFSPPQGAYYVMADFREIPWTPAHYVQPGWSRDRAFAEFLIREVGVAGVPGSSFYFGPDLGTSLIRFNFAKDEQILRRAVSRLEKIKP